MSAASVTRLFGFVLLAIACMAQQPWSGANYGPKASALPMITSVSAVGTNGGTAQVSGANFYGSSANLPVAMVWLGGYPGTVATPLSVTWNSTTSIYLTLSTAGGPYTAGIYAIQVFFPGGTSILDTGNFQITTRVTLATIFGGNLKGDWPCSACTCSGTCTTGSAITGCPDQTSNGNNWNSITSSAPTITLNDSRWLMPNVTTCNTLASSSQAIGIASLNLGSSPAAVYILGAVDVLSATNAYIWDWNVNNAVFGQRQGTGWQFELATFTDEATVGPPPTLLNTPAIFETGFNGTTGVNWMNNAVTASVSAATSPANSEPLYIGLRGTVASPVTYGTISFPEIIAVNVVPSSTQAAETAQYWNDTYGVTTPPGFAYATPMLASTASAPLRVQNTSGMVNYYATTTGELVSGTATYACTNVANSTKYIDFTCASTPAGTYNLFLQNPDGRAQTYVNAVTVTAAANPWTCVGFGVAAWFKAAGATCAGGPCVGGSSKVSGYSDYSALGNTPTQATSGDQPYYCDGVSTSNGCGTAFGSGVPYVLPNGTTTYLELAGGLTTFVINDAPAASPCAAFAIASTTSSSATKQIFEAVDGQYLSYSCGVGYSTITPQLWAGFNYAGGGGGTGGTTNYGSTVSGLQNIEGEVPTGASPTVSINHANGTATTASTTYTTESWSGTGSHVFARGGVDDVDTAYADEPTIEMVGLTVIPTSTQRSCIETYAQSLGAQ